MQPHYLGASFFPFTPLRARGINRKYFRSLKNGQFALSFLEVFPEQDENLLSFEGNSPSPCRNCSSRVCLLLFLL